MTSLRDNLRLIDIARECWSAAHLSWPAAPAVHAITYPHVTINLLSFSEDKVKHNAEDTVENASCCQDIVDHTQGMARVLITVTLGGRPPEGGRWWSCEGRRMQGGHGMSERGCLQKKVKYTGHTVEGRFGTTGHVHIVKLRVININTYPSWSFGMDNVTKLKFHSC